MRPMAVSYQELKRLQIMQNSPIVQNPQYYQNKRMPTQPLAANNLHAVTNMRPFPNIRHLQTNSLSQSIGPVSYMPYYNLSIGRAFNMQIRPPIPELVSQVCTRAPQLNPYTQIIQSTFNEYRGVFPQNNSDQFSRLNQNIQFFPPRAPNPLKGFIPQTSASGYFD